MQYQPVRRPERSADAGIQSEPRRRTAGRRLVEVGYLRRVQRFSAARKTATGPALLESIRDILAERCETPRSGHGMGHRRLRPDVSAHGRAARRGRPGRSSSSTPISAMSNGGAATTNVSLLIDIASAIRSTGRRTSMSDGRLRAAGPGSRIRVVAKAHCTPCPEGRRAYSAKASRVDDNRSGREPTGAERRSDEFPRRRPSVPAGCHIFVTAYGDMHRSGTRYESARHLRAAAMKRPRSESDESVG